MIDRASSAAQAKLADLLLDLFSVDELRRFVHFRYPKLEHELREGTSHRGQTESLTETLLRHGELDEDFFSALLALAQIRSEHEDIAVSDFDLEQDLKPPTLTMYYAHYDIEGKLQLSYQFTEETFYASSDNQWDDYTWSTRVAAPRLPAALADLGTAPRLLQQYWQTTPHHAGSHGWTAAPRTPEVRRRLRQCFAELNSTDPA